VACSGAHAEQIGGTTRFVHYGLNLADWPHGAAKTQTLVHISKIARYKAQHEAIRAARRAGRPITIAGNIENQFYYWTRVRPALLLSERRARYIGEVRDTGAVLRTAAALVQTPRWFDAFPLIVLESLASGTPVIAYATGGLPEQIIDGVTGYLCRDEAELSARMADIGTIRPANCRNYAEEHFSVQRMVEKYATLYTAARDGERW
jgi:glycosyltransferase involved in cell wall biosynthesis